MRPPHLAQAGRHDVDVVLRERRVPIAGDQDPLARDLEVGHQFRPQLGIAHLAAQVRPGEALHDRAEHPVAADQPVEQAVADEILDEPLEAPHAGNAAQHRALQCGRRPVHPRHDPPGRALKHGHVRRARLDLGDELDRRCARPDDRDALAAQVVIVVPAGRVKDRALEGLQPLDLWDLRLGQRAGGVDEEIRGQLEVSRGDRPELTLVVPGGIEQLLAEMQLRFEAVLGGDRLDVAADLGPAGECVPPLGIRRGRERVQV